jgi:hypothetical protein
VAAVELLTPPVPVHVPPPKPLVISPWTAASVAPFTIMSLSVRFNALVIRAGDPAAVRSAITSAFNHGAWNGFGIASTAAAAADPSTAIGYASNALLNKTSFAGVTGLTSSDVLVKFTYAGDANLDGQVDIGDLGLLSGNWQQSGKDWFGGDFTYEGIVDIADLGALAGNWQKGVGNPL